MTPLAVARGLGLHGTESLDLPTDLQKLIPQEAQTNNQFTGEEPIFNPSIKQPLREISGDDGGGEVLLKGYAMGGEVGVGGAPVPPSGAPVPPGGAGLQGPGQAQPQRIDPKMMELEMQKFMRERPEQVNQIKQAIMEALQTGELTQEELNMVVQLATVASQNPDMYPQVRQFAIQQGLATEADISPEYDQGLIFVLLLAAKAAQQQPGGNFMAGGEVAAGTTPTADDVNINVSKGEFVIPAHVVKAKGTDFFEKLINPKGGSNS